jgi:hypothetical protein
VSEFILPLSEIKHPLSGITRFDPPGYYLNFMLHITLANKNNAFKTLSEIAIKQRRKTGDQKTVGEFSQS